MDFPMQIRSRAMASLFILLALAVTCSSSREVILRTAGNAASGSRRLLKEAMLRPEDYTFPIPNNKHDPQLPGFMEGSNASNRG